MARRARPRPLSLALPLLCWLTGAAAQTLPDIQVSGLLPNQAVVTINGQQRILKTGKPSPEGIVLLSADSKSAVFDWQGQRIERTLSRQITSNFTPPIDKPEVRIERGINGHYIIPGHINGRLVNFMVDTGAFTVAMNHTQADNLGLDWRRGRRFAVETAGGTTPSYEVNLETVTVGGITLHNVRCSVVVADSDNDILLGMSFLSQTEMHEENNTLVLRKKY